MKKIKLFLTACITMLFFMQAVQVNAQTISPDAFSIGLRGWLETNWGLSMDPPIVHQDLIDAIEDNGKTLNVSGLSLTSDPPGNGLKGLEYFIGLEELYCSGCGLTTIPPFPHTLLTIDCSINNLTSLPDLPGGLTYLDCSANSITGTFNTLSGVLTYLNCSNNQITGTFPGMSGTLKTLDCTNNKLEGFNGLGALEYLRCGNNEIQVLPTFPGELLHLECNNNFLQELPTFPGGLLHLNCSNNSLSELPTFPNLLFLNCSNNQLLNLPTYFPNSLVYIDCSSNLLTELPWLYRLEDLEVFICSENKLTSLPVLPGYSGVPYPGKLETLDISNNLLGSLNSGELLIGNINEYGVWEDGGLPESLKYLYCTLNNLNDVDILHLHLADFEFEPQKLAMTAQNITVTATVPTTNVLVVDGTTGADDVHGLNAKIEIVGNPGLTGVSHANPVIGNISFTFADGKTTATLPIFSYMVGDVFELATLTAATQGVYPYTVTLYEGTDKVAESSATLTVMPELVVTYNNGTEVTINDGETITLCLNDEIYLYFYGEGPHAVDYTVNGADPASIGLPLISGSFAIPPAHVSISAGAEGTFLFELVSYTADGFAGLSINSFTAIVNPIPTLTVSYNGTEVNNNDVIYMCQDDQIRLTFTGSTPLSLDYTVNGADPALIGLPTLTSIWPVSPNFVSIPAGAPGLYEFVLVSFTDNNGCPGESITKFTANVLPSLPMTAQPITVADGIEATGALVIDGTTGTTTHNLRAVIEIVGNPGLIGVNHAWFGAIPFTFAAGTTTATIDDFSYMSGDEFILATLTAANVGNYPYTVKLYDKTTNVKVGEASSTITVISALPMAANPIIVAEGIEGNDILVIDGTTGTETHGLRAVIEIKGDPGLTDVTHDPLGTIPFTVAGSDATATIDPFSYMTGVDFVLATATAANQGYYDYTVSLYNSDNVKVGQAASTLFVIPALPMTAQPIAVLEGIATTGILVVNGTSGSPIDDMRVVIEIAGDPDLTGVTHSVLSISPFTYNSVTNKTTATIDPFTYMGGVDFILETLTAANAGTYTYKVFLYNEDNVKVGESGSTFDVIPPLPMTAQPITVTVGIEATNLLVINGTTGTDDVHNLIAVIEIDGNPGLSGVTHDHLGAITFTYVAGKTTATIDPFSYMKGESFILETLTAANTGIFPYTVSLYNGTLKIGESSSTLTVQPRLVVTHKDATTVIGDGATVTVCLGDQIRLYFYGTGPHALNYTVNGDDPTSIGLPLIPGSWAVAPNYVGIPAGAEGTFVFELVSYTGNGIPGISISSFTAIVNPVPTLKVSYKGVEILDGETVTMCQDDEIWLDFEGAIPLSLLYTVNGLDPSTIGLPNLSTVWVQPPHNVRIPAGAAGTFVFDLVNFIDNIGCPGQSISQFTAEVLPHPSLSITNYLPLPGDEVGCEDDFDFGLKTLAGCELGTQVLVKIEVDPVDAIDAFALQYWQEVYDPTGNPTGDGVLAFEPDGTAIYDPAAAVFGGFQLRDTASYFRIINTNDTEFDVAFTAKLTLYKPADGTELYTFDLPELTIKARVPTLEITNYLPLPGDTVFCDANFDFGVKINPACELGTLAYVEIELDDPDAAAAFEIWYWQEVYLDGAPLGPLVFDPTTGITLYDPIAIAAQDGFFLRDTASYFRIVNTNNTITDVSFTATLKLIKESDGSELNRLVLPEITVIARTPYLAITDYLPIPGSEIICMDDFDFGIKTYPNCELGKIAYVKIQLNDPAAADAFDLMYWQEVYLDGAPLGPLAFDATGMALYDPDAIADQGGFQLRDTASYFRIINKNNTSADISFIATLSLYTLGQNIPFYSLVLPEITLKSITPATLSLTPGFDFLDQTFEVGCVSADGDYDFGVKIDPGCFEGFLAYVEIELNDPAVADAFEIMYWQEVYLDGAPLGPLVFDPITGISLYDPLAIAAQDGFYLRDTSSFFRIINKNETISDITFTATLRLIKETDASVFHTFVLPAITLKARVPSLAITDYMPIPGNMVNCVDDFDFGIKINPVCYAGQIAFVEVELDDPSKADVITIHYWQEVYNPTGAWDGTLVFDPTTGIALYDVAAIAYQGGFQLRDTSSFFRIVNTNSTNADITVDVTLRLYLYDGTVLLDTYTLPTITVIELPTVVLISDPSTLNQQLRVNHNPIKDIVFATTGLSGINWNPTFAGTGLSINFVNTGGGVAGGTLTISGTPNTVGVFNYVITFYGRCGVNFTTEITFDVFLTCPEPAVTNAVTGNTYNIVYAGGRCWYKQNAYDLLDQDGNEIFPVPQPYNHAAYPDVTNNAAIFGLLYTYEAATTTPICPPGWRIPTTEEWESLRIYNNGELLNPEYWLKPNNFTNLINGDQEFDIRGAGFYNSTLQRYEKLYGYTAFWSSEAPAPAHDPLTGIGAVFTSFCLVVEMQEIKLDHAISVRCIMEE